MHQKIKVSIIVPVYNVEEYLIQCIESLINQTLKDIEIILINDGSSDNSPRICNEYIIKDPRVKVVHQENKHQGGARNVGLKIANGEYIAFVDSDDWIPDNFCELLYNQAIETESEIVLTDEIQFDNQKQIFIKSWRDFSNANQIKKIDDSNFISSFSPVCVRLYKKEFITKNQLAFVENCFYEDNSWGCFIILFADKISFTKSGYCYRINREGATTFGKNDEKVFDWVKDFEYFINFTKNKKYDRKKMKLCKIWYLMSFYNYMASLSEENKSIFYQKILEVIKLLNINWIDIVTARNLNKRQKRNLIGFYRFLQKNYLLKKKQIDVLDINSYYKNQKKYDRFWFSPTSI